MLTGSPRQEIVFGYDAGDRLISERTFNSNNTLTNSVAYGYDAASNRTSKTANNVVSSCLYDDCNQLTTLTNDATPVAYTYDANGNRATRVTGGHTEFPELDQSPRLESISSDGLSMNCITVREAMTVHLPERFLWSFDREAGLLSLLNQDIDLNIEMHLMDYGIPKLTDKRDRLDWSHQWLVDYVRDVIGPPYTSNLAKVEGSTWVGWQAVNSLGEGQFAGTRCIVANQLAMAARISFPLRRDAPLEEVTYVLENVAFERVNASTTRRG